MKNCFKYNDNLTHLGGEDQPALRSTLGNVSGGPAHSEGNLLKPSLQGACRWLVPGPSFRDPWCEGRRLGISCVPCLWGCVWGLQISSDLSLPQGRTACCSPWGHRESDTRSVSPCRSSHRRGPSTGGNPAERALGVISDSQVPEHSDRKSTRLNSRC